MIIPPVSLTCCHKNLRQSLTEKLSVFLWKNLRKYFIYESSHFPHFQEQKTPNLNLIATDITEPGRLFLSFSFRQLLCPALIQLLGSPLNDLNKRPKTVTPFPEEINRGGRGTGNFAKSSSVVGPIPRTIYNIATELLRLVGSLAAMRPVLESLFHRIILYPPAQQRAEALKALKEVQWIGWSSGLFSLLAC